MSREAIPATPIPIVFVALLMGLLIPQLDMLAGEPHKQVAESQSHRSYWQEEIENESYTLAGADLGVPHWHRGTGCGHRHIRF